ncbi:MAG: ABC transporter permease [Chitinophagaceae bacterium]|nr:ABC transporter permease [Chitinophagaceae bacterium]
MLSIYFITAWRSIWKKKFFACVNIFGLSVATAAFLLLINYVQFEKSYEKYNPNADNIYRLTLDLYKGSEFVVTDCETYPPMGPTFKSTMPEVKDFVRIQDIGESEAIYQQKAFLIPRVYGADPSLIDLFAVNVLKGDAKAALASPAQTVITESIARKFFGDEDAIGKVLKIQNESLSVGAVIADVPENTHMKFDLLFSLSLLEKWGYDMNNWGGNNNYTYLLMKPGTDLLSFNNKLKQFSVERLKQEVVTAEPISSIHLYSNKTFEPDINGNARTVNFLLMVAFLIIFIGSANYVNLTTARAAEKSKEAGLRKVLGSSRGSLVGLFFTESFIINVLALGGAMILIWSAMPFYGSLVGEPAKSVLFNSNTFWINCGLLFVLNTLLSGIYPAFVLSSVKAVVVTTRNFTTSLKGRFLRRALVVGQFAVALIVLSASVVIYQQMKFIQKQNLGMNIDEVLVIKEPQMSGVDSVVRNASVAFKNKLRQLPGVKSAALAESLPGMGLSSLNTRTNIRRYEETVYSGSNYYLYGIDADFLETMGIELLGGHNFSQNPQENKGKVLINEEAARLLGFSSAMAALNQRIKIEPEDDKFVTVAGVIKNYHQQSLKESQIPLIHWYSRRPTAYYAIKLNTADVRGAVAGIETAWKETFSGHVFDYSFMDEMFNQQYKADVQFGKIINLFAIFTLFITVLGLLGLASYDSARRRKEIGIRKVLGASATGLMAMLSKDFLKLVLISLIIAVPVCWFALNKWLQNFAYRVEISWLVFLATGLLVIIIAFVTISLQSAKTTMVNPVKSLRSE